MNYARHLIDQAKRRYRRLTRSGYPFTDGDFTVIGPEAFFLTSDSSVICYQGENYERHGAPSPTRYVSSPLQRGKTFREDHTHMLRAKSQWGGLREPLASEVRKLIVRREELNRWMLAQKSARARAAVEDNVVPPLPDLTKLLADISKPLPKAELIGEWTHEPGFKERHFDWKEVDPANPGQGQYRYLEEGKYDAHPTETFVEGYAPCGAMHPEHDELHLCKRPKHNRSYHLDPSAPAGKRAWEYRA